MQFQGDGEFKQDISAAIKTWEEATAEGSARAFVELGDCYAEGIGVALDLGKAMDMYREGAKRTLNWGRRDEEWTRGVAHQNLRYAWFSGTRKECPTLMQQLGLVKLPQPGPWADRRGYDRLVAAGKGDGERNEALGADVVPPGYKDR